MWYQDENRKSKGTDFLFNKQVQSLMKNISRKSFSNTLVHSVKKTFGIVVQKGKHVLKSQGDIPQLTMRYYSYQLKIPSQQTMFVKFKKMSRKTTDVIKLFWV